MEELLSARNFRDGRIEVDRGPISQTGLPSIIVVVWKRENYEWRLLSFPLDQPNLLRMR